LLSVIVGVAAGSLAAVLWGGGAVVSRHLVTTSIPPADLAFLRYAGCFPVAFALHTLWPARFRCDVPVHRLLVLLLLAGPPYQVLLVAGYGEVTAGTGALLVCGLLPLFALAMSASVGQRRPGPAQAAGVIATVLGVSVFALSGGHELTGTANGFALFAAAALMWAALNALVRHWQVDPWRLTVALALWSPVFLPVWVIARAPEMISAPAADVLLQVGYHGIGVAFFATALSFIAVGRLGSVKAGVLQAMTPATAALLGALILGEMLTDGQWLAIALTVGGIGLSIAGIQPAAAPKRSNP
jgi:drug/metabolite transporter (DMT)-like permease